MQIQAHEKLIFKLSPNQYAPSSNQLQKNNPQSPSSANKEINNFK